MLHATHIAGRPAQSPPGIGVRLARRIRGAVRTALAGGVTIACGVTVSGRRRRPVALPSLNPSNPDLTAAADSKAARAPLRPGVARRSPALKSVAIAAAPVAPPAPGASPAEPAAAIATTAAAAVAAAAPAAPAAPAMDATTRAASSTPPAPPPQPARRSWLARWFGAGRRPSAPRPIARRHIRRRDIDIVFTPETCPGLPPHICKILNTPAGQCDPEAMRLLFSALARAIADRRPPAMLAKGLSDADDVFHELWGRFECVAGAATWEPTATWGPQLEERIEQRLRQVAAMDAATADATPGPDCQAALHLDPEPAAAAASPAAGPGASAAQDAPAMVPEATGEQASPGWLPEGFIAALVDAFPEQPASPGLPSWRAKARHPRLPCRMEQSHGWRAFAHHDAAGPVRRTTDAFVATRSVTHRPCGHGRGAYHGRGSYPGSYYGRASYYGRGSYYDRGSYYGRPSYYGRASYHGRGRSLARCTIRLRGHSVLQSQRLPARRLCYAACAGPP